MNATRAELMTRHGIAVEPPFETWPTSELYPKCQGLIIRENDAVRVLDVACWGFPPDERSRFFRSPFFKLRLKLRWRNHQQQLEGRAGSWG